MTALFCSAFQFFHSVGKAFETHPLAPFLLLEVTLAILILLASASILMQIAVGRVRPIDLFFFGFPIAWLMLSAGFAWLSFSQPLIYGASEDRRVLTFLYWFAFDPVRRRYGLSASDVLLALTICAGVYLAVGIGLQVFVPERLNARALPDLDVRRLRMSAPGNCFAFVFLVGLTGSMVSKCRTVSVVAAVIGLAGLLQIAQSRQLILAALASASIIIWLLRPAWALAIATIGTAAFLAGIYLRGPVLFEQVIDALLPNISEFFGASLVENARVNTMAIVTRRLIENYFIGLGAVSLLYDGGLGRVYGRDVFINDVGLFGELFRVGAFYLGFVWAYVALSLKLWQRIALPKHRVLIGSLFLFIVLVGPTDGFFYRFGFVHAFLFLLMTAAGSRVPTISARTHRSIASPGAYQGAL